MFNNMKQLFDLKKKFDQMKNELSKIEVESNQANGKVKLVVTADQKVKSLHIDPEFLSVDKKEQLEKHLKECINDVSGKSQKIAMEKMMGLTQGINIPGLSNFLK